MADAASSKGLENVSAIRPVGASETASPLMQELLQRALVRPADLGTLEDCKKLSVLIPRDLHRELKTFAFRHQTTITDLILAMVVELLSLEQERNENIAS